MNLGLIKKRLCEASCHIKIPWQPKVILSYIVLLALVGMFLVPVARFSFMYSLLLSRGWRFQSSGVGCVEKYCEDLYQRSETPWNDCKSICWSEKELPLEFWHFGLLPLIIIFVLLKKFSLEIGGQKLKISLKDLFTPKLILIFWLVVYLLLSPLLLISFFGERLDPYFLDVFTNLLEAFWSIFKSFPSEILPSFTLFSALPISLFLIFCLLQRASKEPRWRLAFFITLITFILIFSLRALIWISFYLRQMRGPKSCPSGYDLTQCMQGPCCCPTSTPENVTFCD